MTDDTSRIFYLMTPPEIAILLGMDADFTLPAFTPHGKQKMRAARQILAGGVYDVADMLRYEDVEDEDVPGGRSARAAKPLVCQPQVRKKPSADVQRMKRWAREKKQRAVESVMSAA